MTPTSPVQRNPYKGMSPRCWVRLRFVAADGSLHERELLADTGCPSAVILGLSDLTLLDRGAAAGRGSNFGPLAGAWLELRMPELGLNQRIIGYGSDNVWQIVQHDSPDFAGLVGLPVLRMVEYGGDSTAFWLATPPGVP
jgi:hypothetical protein